jgi:alkylation response protein AidB-like acyl-CoA dehydrogenase
VTATADPRLAEPPPPIPDALAKALRDIGDPAQLRQFPRLVIQRLGELGVLRRRWACGPPGDVRYGTELAEEAARHAPGGIAVGIGVHTEPVLAMLCRFGNESGYLSALCEQALDGAAVGCVASSEAAHGSDVSAVECLATAGPEGWRVTGSKKYVSLGAVADFVIVLCRLADQAGKPTRRLGTIVIPREQAQLICVHEKVGAPALDTAALTFTNAVVPREAMLGRPGLGLAVLSYGLSFERLAVAAQVLGGCALNLELAVEHASRRVQFGAVLRDHQYLEFRLAEMWAELEVLRGAVGQLAERVMTEPLSRLLAARIAAVKLHAARLGERLVSECMQTFGGSGYLTAETPVGQFWRDVRLARIGGGTDEMMLALAAGELRGNPQVYDECVRIPV